MLSTRYIAKLIFSRNLHAKFNSTMCEIAVCQFTATNDKEANLAVVRKLVTEAANRQAKIAFLPEACDFVGTSAREIHDMAESLEGPTVGKYKDLAKDLNVWISVGGVHETCSKDQIYNSHILIDNNGEIKSVYRKLHLFDVSIPEKNIELEESKYVHKGSEITTPIKTPAGALALSICYDLRFPELGILQTRNGATILSYPSAFTTATGEAHWEILLRSRAIENQCYVVAAAQYGKHNDKRISYGNSMIVDPWGRIIAECPKYREGINTDESIATASVNLALVNKIRKEMPVSQHRRKDLYDLNQILPKTLPISNNDTFNFADILIPVSNVFLKTKHCFAFTNIRCVVPGHVLVATMRPVQKLSDLTQDEISDLFQTVVFVEKIMESVHDTTSSTICVQDGKDAGQTIKHVHVHILPRTQNDFSRNDDIYAELAKHDRDDNSDAVRNQDEMNNEATVLRKLIY